MKTWLGQLIICSGRKRGDLSDGCCMREIVSRQRFFCRNAGVVQILKHKFVLSGADSGNVDTSINLDVRWYGGVIDKRCEEHHLNLLPNGESLL